MSKVKKARGVRGTSRSGNSKARNAPSGIRATYEVLELDPQRKCGAGTSVQQLFRVDESLDGRSQVHLVFFDRHGWYCEHGRNCPAVPHARRIGDGARHTGRTSKR